MYLIFPKSMIIPEVANRHEDNHFEDWLVAALIENTNQKQPEDSKSSLPGITDLWMLEIAERSGKTWTGRFNVEFEMGEKTGTKSSPVDQALGMLFFSLDTDTGEMRFA